MFYLTVAITIVVWTNLFLVSGWPTRSTLEVRGLGVPMTSPGTNSLSLVLELEFGTSYQCSVVLSMDPGRNRIKSSHFALLGVSYNSAIRAEKVIYIEILKINND